MIKIGHKHEIEQLTALPIEVKEIIARTLGILDCEYGEKRNIDADLGGYVLIFESQEDVKELDRLNIDENTVFECAEKIQCSDDTEYLYATLMSNNDFVIILVVPVDISPIWLSNKS